MKSCNLEQGELVVLQCGVVSPVSAGAWTALTLTNKHLILVLTVPDGSFRASCFPKRFPLEQVLDDVGVPCTIVTKVNGRYVFNAAFAGEAISLASPADLPETPGDGAMSSRVPQWATWMALVRPAW
ncbi:hypothetical protein [Olsenella sp. Marseille-P4559]|uniref:hypothetical protein n=1 Tax=Olsenella sp. Marseille-P4559 TaxID=2364795 RepID=UPI00103026B7|nr:hypothetical protein [Olsenella sp. Marseille-P4559]